MLVGKHWVPLKTWNNIGIEEQKKKKKNFYINKL